jgi:hypothetical protein
MRNVPSAVSPQAILLFSIDGITMLPEQRGLLSSFKSWLRGSTPSKTRAKRAKARHRSPQLEALEPRQVLTATIYVDFGDRLGTQTHTESEWANLQLAVPMNQVSWINGPEFPYANNPMIQYTPFDVPQNFPIDFGPNFGGEPWEFETGPELPISKEDAAQISIIDTLQRMFAPFNIQVVEAAAANLGEVRTTLASNNRLTDPYETIKQMPSVDMYNLTTANPAGLQPPGFNPLQLNPLTGGPAGMKDVYIFVGGWTRDNGGTRVQIGADPGIVGGTTPVPRNFGFGSVNGGASFVDPFTNDPTKPQDPIMGFSGVPILYSEGGGAVCADTIMDEVLAGKTELITAVATVAAQQAGYAYGLFHTQNGEAKINNPFFDPDVDTLSASDMMREGRHENINNAQPSLDDVAVFSRLPLMLGDLNQNPTFQQNAFDTLINNPDVGPNAGTVPVLFNSVTQTSVFANILSVTGTGASDRITITPDLTNPLGAIVTVDAYRTGEMLPTDLIDSFSYNLNFTLPAGVLFNALFIDAGRGDDQIEIDPTIAGLVGTNIEIFGGGGKDNISFTGTGVEDATIAVANVASFRFNKIEQFLTQIQIGQFVATLFEFNDDSTIHLENFNSLNYNLPQFLPSNFSVTAQLGSNLAIPPGGTGVNMVIDGTAGPTDSSPVVNVINVEFTNITSVSVLSLVGLTGDTVSVNSDLGFADGLQNFAVGLGPGNDSLILTGTNFTLPVAGGVFVFDGGLGKDTIVATGDTDWTLINGDPATFTDGMLICGGGGVITLQNMIGDNAIITGGASDNAITIESWTGDLTLNGLGGNDTFNIGTAISSVSGQLIALGGAGDDIFLINNWSGSGTISGEAGKDTFTATTLSGPDITLDGGDDDDSFQIGNWTGVDGTLLGGDGDDTFAITSIALAGDLTIDLGIGKDTFTTDLLGALSLNALGGDGDDTFTIGILLAPTISMDGGLGSDTFAINSLAATSLILLGGANDDVFDIKTLSATLFAISGGTGVDRFEMDTWSGTGSMLGGDGNDIFHINVAAALTVTIDGGNNNDTFDVNSWAGKGSVSGSAGIDTFNINSLTGSNVSFDGGTGNDTFNFNSVNGVTTTVTGSDGVDTFNVKDWAGTGTISGGIGNDVFVVTKLTGSADISGDDGNDTFTMSGWTGSGSASGGVGNDGFGGTLAGANIALDGGADDDTFEIAAWTGAVGSLLGGTGNDTIHINSLGALDFTLDAGAGNDAIGITTWNGDKASALGGDGDDVFDIKTFSVTAFSMDGGTGIDRFEMDTWTGTGTVLGGAGNDIFHIKAPAGLNVAIDGGNNNDTFDINSWLGTGSVAGGAGDDTFNVNATSVTNFTLDAGAGTDTLTATGDTDWTLTNGDAVTDGTLICGGGGVITLKNVIGDTAIITGGAGNNAIKVNSWSGPLTVNGLGGNDTITIGTATTSVSGKLTALGGTGNDSFQVNNWSGIGSISGEAGNDNITLGGNANLTTKPDISGGAGLDSFTLDDSLLASAIDYIINDFIITSKLAGFAGVNLDTFENITVNGSQGPNTFNVTPSFNTTFRVNGNGAVGGENVLNVDFTLTTNPKPAPGLAPPGAGNGAWQFSSGQQPVIFTGIDTRTVPLGFPEHAFLAVGAGEGKGSKPLIKVYDAKTNGLLFSFYAYETSFTGGVRVALADINDDGVDDIVAAPGPGRAGQVKVFDGRELFTSAGAAGKTLVTAPTFALVGGTGFYSDGKTYKSGLYVAAADVDGDGAVDVVTSTQTGAGKIRVFGFDGGGFSQSRTFVPYSSADKVKTGAVLTTADVDGDGVADIITAPGGAGTAAIIKVFDGSTGASIRKFNGFESSFKNGVSLAAADLDGDGLAEIMVGAGTNGKSRVRVLDGSGTLLKEFKAVTSGSTINAPLQLATHEVDGQIELFVAQNNSATSHKIMHFDPLTGSLIDSFLEKEVVFKPGLNLG